jgi:ribosome-binding protein aMBF1 (putative translation factor)
VAQLLSIQPVHVGQKGITRRSQHEAGHSRWEDIKKLHPEPSPELRAQVAFDHTLGQLIYDLRIAAGLSEKELAERMGTSPSVISNFEEGGGAENRLDTLIRIAKALDRHLVLSFPEKVSDNLADSVRVV